MVVNTACIECYKNERVQTDRIGIAQVHTISENLFLVSIIFYGCGHRRLAFLTKKQLESMEVKDETHNNTKA